MKLYGKHLSYQTSWEARNRLLSKLYRRTLLTQRISLGLLIVLLLVPLPLPTRYAIAIPIILLNLAFHLYFQYKSHKHQRYMKDSFLRLVQEDSDRTD